MVAPQLVDAFEQAMSCGRPRTRPLLLSYLRGTLPGVNLYVAATSAGRTVDLCVLKRSQRRFVFVMFESPGVHDTWRDGERPHLKSDTGDLADSRMDPGLVEAIREHYGNARLWAPGWESGRWAVLPDDVSFTQSRIFHGDGLDPLPPAKDRRGDRLTVELGEDDGVNVAHYLCRPGKATNDFLATQAADPLVQFWRCDLWEPWSIVTAKLLPNAVVRGNAVASGRESGQPPS